MIEHLDALVEPPPSQTPRLGRLRSELSLLCDGLCGGALQPAVAHVAGMGADLSTVAPRHPPRCDSSLLWGRGAPRWMVPQAWVRAEGCGSPTAAQGAASAVSDSPHR